MKELIMGIRLKELKWSILGIFFGMFVMGGIGFYWMQPPAFPAPQKPIVVDPQQLKADISYLTESLRPFRNVDNPDALDQAADYIRHEWEKITPNVVAQKYPVQGHTYQNIIASFGPLDQARWVVGAHYDVAGNQPGADDNASGIAGILALGRLLKEVRLPHRVDLVAYTLEEPPFFRTPQMGSAIHVQSLQSEQAKLKGMISLEMIGYFTDAPKSQAYPLGLLHWFFPAEGNFIAVVGNWSHGSLVKQVAGGIAAGSSVPVESLSAPDWIEGIDFSDHANYAAAGFPAVMVTDTAFYRNPNYHTPGDQIDTLNFKQMAEVIKGVYWTIIH